MVMTRRSRIGAWIGILCGVALASACTKAPIPYREPLAVTPPRGPVAVKQALLVLDASGSLEDESFAESRALLESIVASMPPGDYQAGLLVFGGFDREWAGMSSFSRARLASAAKDVRFLEGSSPIYDVIEEEISSALMGEPGRAAVVLISDGLATDYAGRAGVDQRTVEAARELVAARSGKTCLHTIASGDHAAGASLLRAVAETSTCGSFRQASSLDSARALQAFARKVFLAGAQPPTPADPARVDTDGDGVVNAKDACPRTLRGAPVDERGCWTLDDLRFAVDGAQIRPGGTAELNEAIRVLKANPGVGIRIEGHTDSDGPAAYNQRLSERRAQAVRDYLVKQGGLDPARFQVRGLGESRPAVPNESPEQKRRNRRVELTILD